MKTKEQVSPTLAPIYTVGVYPKLAKLCVENGYALAVHGSLQNDLDLIAIPWTKEAVSIRKLLNQIEKTFALKFEKKPTKREFGRVAYAMYLSFGTCTLDFSVFPKLLDKHK